MSDKKPFAQLIGDLTIINVPTNVHDYLVNNSFEIADLCNRYLKRCDIIKVNDGSHYYELTFKKSIYRSEYWKVYQLLYNCPKFY